MKRGPVREVDLRFCGRLVVSPFRYAEAVRRSDIRVLSLTFSRTDALESVCAPWRDRHGPMWKLQTLGGFVQCFGWRKRVYVRSSDCTSGYRC